MRDGGDKAMQKIKLNNGDTFQVDDFATANKFVIILGNESAEKVLEALTETNLSEVKFLASDGTTTGVIKNKLLRNVRITENTIEVNVNDADLCRYGLVLDKDNRITGTYLQRYAPAGAVIVDALPKGNVNDYLRIDGAYIYDPLPEPETPEPTPDPLERIAALEEQLAAAKILLGVE